MTYLLFITIGLVATYFVGYFLFPLFFGREMKGIKSRSLVSLAVIVVLSLIGYFVSFRIPDPELGNRFLHGFGGGFMALLVCFLVVRDLKLEITKFQFFVFSFLLVSTLGVGNEILEFILQHYFSFVSAPSVEDTWLDLVSNTIGLLIASASLTPYTRAHG